MLKDMAKKTDIYYATLMEAYEALRGLTMVQDRIFTRMGEFIIVRPDSILLVENTNKGYIIKTVNY
jgi:DNA-binding transcriptional regulator YhcF (GntR family)